MGQRRRVVPVILSGGSGTRLWPLSREAYPQQLLPLMGEVSLFQETALRLHGHGFARPIIVCGEGHRHMVAEQLSALGIQPESIILEAAPRGTAPAVAAAALTISRYDPDALMLVCPADHAVSDVPAFLRTVATAARVASRDFLVPLSVSPRSAETGYGWMQTGAPVPGIPSAVQVAAFVEKPDQETAATMLSSGRWVWNSGIFVFPPSLLVSELDHLQPDVLTAVRAAVDSSTIDAGFVRLGSEQAASPCISIDHAVLEHTARAVMVDAEFMWSDVGSWDSLWALSPRDQADNVVVGNVLTQATQGCYIRGEGVLVATVGLESAVVVATRDAVLVANRSSAQEVKRVVERLQVRQRPEAATHAVVHRPWGWYETVDAGPGYQVKRLTVKPGHQLSLQRHAHRSEHWVLVNGTAEVVRGEDLLTMTPPMSIDIPTGCVHRLSNPGQELLQVVEVQTGSYLGEDDIERLEDAYGRETATDDQVLLPDAHVVDLQRLRDRNLVAADAVVDDQVVR